MGFKYVTIPKEELYASINDDDFVHNCQVILFMNLIRTWNTYGSTSSQRETLKKLLLLQYQTKHNLTYWNPKLFNVGNNDTKPVLLMVLNGKKTSW
jgi:hypothetical protein